MKNATMVNKSKITTDVIIERDFDSIISVDDLEIHSGSELEIHSYDGDDNSLSMESNENSDFSTSLNNENENENLRLPRTWFVRHMPADDEDGDVHAALRNLNARDETLFEL